MKNKEDDFDIVIDKVSTEPPVCSHCKHFFKDGDGLTCKAFPQGIPDDILSLEDNHEDVRPDQEGDWVYEEGDGLYLEDVE
jgi:hypothetical protein